MPPHALPQVRGRYAPSPSGDLHLGNLRTALLAWLFARTQHGRFLLRIEDLDLPRVRAGASQKMLDDLHWLGLDWDEGPDCSGPYSPYTQSARIDLYEQYLLTLQQKGLIYPCYCSRAEIAQASAPQQGDEDGPRYPGTCRTLTHAQRTRYEQRGRRPALRLRVDDTREVTFSDLLAGPSSQHVQRTTGDFVIRRSDGIFAYQFAVVVDDGLMQIDQVVRGADLLTSTARQILLFEALGFPIPTFAHVPLLLDASGQRLAKRSSSSGLDPLRASGLTSTQIIGQLAFSCGLLAQPHPISPKELQTLYLQHTYDIMRAKLTSQTR